MGYRQFLRRWTGKEATAFDHVVKDFEVIDERDKRGRCFQTPTPVPPCCMETGSTLATADAHFDSVDGLLIWRDQKIPITSAKELQ